MGFKEFISNVGRKLANPEKKELKEKLMPEEVELKSYQEQERRDKIRELVHQKRKEHTNFLNFKPPVNFNKDVKPMFQNPDSVKVPKIKKDLYFNFEEDRKKSKWI